jgi:DNA-binding transcriptional LysR family regulator
MARITHLKNYLQVTRLGSFSAAAKAMGLSQPAISQQITALERQLGTVLLLRNSQGVLSLTAAGEVFRDYAEAALEAYEAMEKQIVHLREAIEGDLEVAASAIPGTYLLPAFLMALQRRYPGIDVHLTVANSRDVGEKLRGGQCDIGFMGSPMATQNHRLEPWIKDEIVLAVYSDHPFASRPSVGLEELQGQPLIIREEGSGTRATVEQLLREHGQRLAELNVALVLGGTHGVAHAIRSGLGIGFVSTHAAESNDLAMVHLAGIDFTRELYMAYEPARVCTGLHQAFLEFAREWASDHS